MPYIEKLKRKTFEPELQRLRILLSGGDISPGDLNYVITCLLKSYLGSTPGYTRYNAAMGVMECAKLELYRKWVSPYEDKKIIENGEVE